MGYIDSVQVNSTLVPETVRQTISPTEPTLLGEEKIKAMLPREPLFSAERLKEIGIDFDVTLQSKDQLTLIKNLTSVKLNIDSSDIGRLALFIVINKKTMVQYAQAQESSVFYPKELTSCCLSFDVTPEGRVFVHLRQKIKKPIVIGGSYKRGTLSLDPYNGELFLTQTCYLSKRALVSIRNEIDKIAAFKRHDFKHFVPIISSTCYEASQACCDYDWEIVNSKYSLTTPYYPLGDLANHRENIHVDEWIRKIAIAVKELHDHGYLHLDLKLENILVKNKDEICLCDLGNVRNLNQLESINLNLYFAPPEWMLAKKGSPSKTQRALEQMDRGKRYDSYSFGLLIYLLRTGKTEKDLLWGENVSNYHKNEKMGNVTQMDAQYDEIISKKMTFYHTAQPFLGDLAGLLKNDPSLRMSIDRVVELTSQ